MKSKASIIKGNKTEAVISCLKLLEKNTVIQTNGKLGISLDVDYMFIQEIMCAYFPWSKKENVLSEASKRIVISSAMLRWINYKKPASDAAKMYFFQRAVDTEVRKRKNRNSKYSVLMFLNVETINEFKNIRILGKDLCFISWKEVEELDIKNLWIHVFFQDQKNAILDNSLEAQNLIPNNNLFSPIICQVNADTSENALEIADDCLNILRCIMNLPSTLGDYIYFGPRIKALAKLLPSPIFAIFDENGKRTNVSLTIEKYEYKREQINDSHKEAIKYLLSLYSEYPTNNSLEEYTLNILRLYQRALDTTLTESAYLAMWQVLENSVAFGDKSLDNQSIKSRIKFIGKLDAISSNMVDILTDKRNELVHSGKYPTHGYNLFQNLKLLTETIVYRLISYMKEFSTVSDLKDYVNYSSLGSDDLERKKMSIEKLLIERQRK